MRYVLIVVFGIIVGAILYEAIPSRSRPAASAGGGGTVARDSTTPAQRSRGPLPVEQRVRQIELNPTDVRYDPVALAQQEKDNLTTVEIFLAEPRDPSVAPILERRLNSTMRTIIDELQLGPRVKSIKVECHTLTCSTCVEVAKSDAGEIYDQLNGIMIAESQSPDIDQSGVQSSCVSIVSLMRPESRDQKYYDEFLREGMRPALEAAKKKYLHP